MMLKRIDINIKKKIYPLEYIDIVIVLFLALIMFFLINLI